MNEKRVVITGLGIISPSGLDLDNFWSSIINGENKIDRITKFDTSKFEVKIAGEIRDFEIKQYGFPFMLTRQLDTFTHYALAASKLALDDSGIELDKENKNQIGVFMGNCLGGVAFGERELYNLYRKGVEEVSPYQAISWFYTAPQGQISIRFNLKGFSKTFASDRISSDLALGYAFKSILRNRINAALTGGSEAGISTYGFLGFMKSGIFSKRNDNPKGAYRPYNVDCDGLVLGEGSGILLLEELDHALNRDAKIYGEIVGFYSNCDGVHHQYSDDNGEGFQIAIEKCLEDANTEPSVIDYINLDGVGIRNLDIIETNVLKRVFGKHINKIGLSCPKVCFGHTYGSAGAIDMIINCLALKTNMIPPTINYENPYSDCDLDYTSNKAKEKEINSVLQIARGRGGINSALILKRFEG